MLRKIAFRALVLATVAFELVGRPAAAQTAQPQLLFGVVIPLTGSLAESYGVPVRNGIEMAIEEINAAGYGFTVKAEYCDHAGEAQRGAQCANQLINAFQIPFISTNFTPITLAMAPLATRTKTLVMNSVATSPSLAKASEYVWNSTALGQSATLVDATFIVRTLGIKTVDMVFWNNNEIGLQYSKLVPSYIKAAGGEVLNLIGFNPDAADFSNYIAKIKESRAQAMYFVAAGAGPGSLIRQLRAQGYDKPIIAFQGFPGPESEDALGATRQNLYSSFAADLDGPGASAKAKQFAAAYEKKFGKQPHPSAAQHYDAIRYVLAPLLVQLHTRKLPVTGEDLVKALREIQNFPEGATGPTEFVLAERYSLKPKAIKRLLPNKGWEHIDTVDVKTQVELLKTVMK